MDDVCIKRLVETHQRMVKYYDRIRKEPPLYGVSNPVMLNGKYIRTWQAAKMLDARLFRPFKVKKLVGPEGQYVQLELPSRWRVYNVFYTSLLEPNCLSGHCNGGAKG